MSDEREAPVVPPGWVRLTWRSGVQVVAPASDWRYMVAHDGSVRAWMASQPNADVLVTESPAEVATLIAEAEAAERRARALPVMAAILRGVRGEKVVPGAASGATYEGCIWTREGAVCEAAAILDAIERREGA